MSRDEMRDSKMFPPPPPKKTDSVVGLGWLILLAGLVLFAYLIANGGSLLPSTPRRRETISNTVDLQGNLDLAINALQAQREFGSGAARVIHYLNQWSELGGTKIEWKRDPLLDKLPPTLNEQKVFQTLDNPKFPGDDMQHLRECLMLRRCATWVSRRPVPQEYSNWLEEIEKQAGAEQREQLAVALNLFDWTIRNIQLEPLLPPPPAPVASAGKDPRSLPAPLRGIPGPGYTRTPTQILLHSKGDAWQRARLFLLLARQAGLNGAILAIQRETSVWEATPWVAAIAIDKKLYLFDAELGLPLPGETTGTIGTLDAYVANTALLRNLDLPGLGTYPIQATDLEKIVAFVDGTTDAISLRMQALQAQLTGERRMVLAAPLAETRESFWKAEGIKQVLLWRVPFETQMYSQTLQKALFADPKRLEEYVRNYGMFEGRTSLAQARFLHLEGIFDTVDQKIGARDFYLQSRPTDRDLRQLAVSKTMRERFGIEEQLPPKDPERQAAIDRIAAILQHTKEYATFALGIVQYETGQYDLAETWFRERIIESAADSSWVPLARYNLGRSLEAQGEWTKARDQYVLDQSPQRYGNVLRATWIKRRQDSAVPAASADGQ